MSFQMVVVPIRRHVSTSISVEKMAGKLSNMSARNECIDEDTETTSIMLTYMQAGLFGAVLEGTLCQLTILENCNTEMKIERINYENEDEERKKMYVGPVEDTDFIKKEDLNSDKYKIFKMDEDRERLTGIIRDTFDDLVTRLSFQQLLTHLQDWQNEENHYELVVAEEISNKRLCRETSKELRRQRVHQKTITYDTNVMIEELRDELEDSSLNASIRCRHVCNWENARSEQHAQTHDLEAKAINDVLNDVKLKTEQEQRIHTEIEVSLSIEVEEVLERIEVFVDNYDKSIEEFYMNIQRKKAAYQDAKEKRIDLEEQFETRTKEIAAWNLFVDDRREKREFEEKMTSAALSIQNWWRGLLVRQHLGPFKPPKKRKGKKGKGSKKK